MSGNKGWLVHILAFGCFICLFAGYFWRMSQESNIIKAKQEQIISRFFGSIEKSEAIVTMLDGWNVYRVGSAFVVVKRQVSGSDYAKLSTE